AGLFMAAGTLPALLFYKTIGKTADRSDLTNILIFSSFAGACVIAVCAACLKLAAFPLSAVYAAGFLTALAGAFMDPAFNKALPELVAKENLESAVALQSSAQPLAYFGGAVAGAALIDLIGVAGVISLNAAIYFLAAMCLAVVVIPKAMGSGDGVRSSFVTSRRQVTNEDLTPLPPSGLALLKDMPLIKNILIGFGFVNFFATPTLVILPIYTSKTLGRSASTLGILEGSLWTGILAGTIASKYLAKTNDILKLGAACLAGLGLCLALPGLVIHATFYAAMLFTAGAVLGINNVKFMTFFQQTVSREIKGRFFSIMQAMISFTFPLAYLLFGLLAARLAPPKICLVQGLGVMCLAFYFLALRKQACLSLAEKAIKRQVKT
ncbi:MAG: MFS transporter, partial [Elusimicrobia bacterium]|nr:MFS transporter [Elusimicrobiota bacterium]